MKCLYVVAAVVTCLMGCESSSAPGQRPPGPEGQQGPKGDTGDQGEVGDKGDTGDCVASAQLGAKSGLS